MPTIITSIFSFFKSSSGIASAITASAAIIIALCAYEQRLGAISADAKYVVATQEAQSKVEKATTTAQLSDRDNQNEYDNQITAIDAYGDSLYASDTNSASMRQGATIPARNRKSIAAKSPRISPDYARKVILIEALGKYYSTAELEINGVK